MFHGRRGRFNFSLCLGLLIGSLAAFSSLLIADEEAVRRLPQNTPISRWANLPTDRGVPNNNDLLQRDTALVAPIEPPPNIMRIDDAGKGQLGRSTSAPQDFAKLLRPTFRLALEWEPEEDDLGISSYDFSMRMPTYPVFGPPPPFIDVGFSFTHFDAPVELDLPTELYDVSLGLSWLRKIHDRWMLRFSASAAFATDGHNESSDAWQFRGTAFAMYSPNERWNWAFGAVVTGRQDLPVIPAVGAIWQPSPYLRLDLTFPQPRIAWVGFQSATRQQWFYIGGGLSGGTWAYCSNTADDHLVTYREWRAVLGWESTPIKEPGSFFTRGRKFGVEIGYSLGREFEFEHGRPHLEFDSGLLIRATASF